MQLCGIRNWIVIDIILKAEIAAKNSVPTVNN